MCSPRLTFITLGESAWLPPAETESGDLPLFRAPAPLPVSLIPELTHSVEVGALGESRGSLSGLKKRERKRELWKDG